MKKRFLVLFSSLLLLILSACSKQASPNAFFKAWQRLFEEPYIAIDGSAHYGQLDLSVHGTLQNDPLGAALVLRQVPPLDFYLKDGLTYLNDNGTKTSSKAENIGLDAKSLERLNPFLSLSPGERKAIFSSVRLSGSTYIMTFSTGELSKVLDQYGAISVSSASMEATIRDEIVTWFSFELKGEFNFNEDNPAAFEISAEFDCTKADGIDFPDDLDTYKSG